MAIRGDAALLRTLAPSHSCSFLALSIWVTSATTINVFGFLQFTGGHYVGVLCQFKEVINDIYYLGNKQTNKQNTRPASLSMFSDEQGRIVEAPFSTTARSPQEFKRPAFKPQNHRNHPATISPFTMWKLRPGDPIASSLSSPNVN